MARYPTFEEYEKCGNFQDGIKRCDDLLRKSPRDVQLLTVKLQLLYAAKEDAQPIMDQLLSMKPPILDLNDLVAIEEAAVDSQRDVFPRPKTAGPSVAKLWDNAFKGSSSTNHRLDLLSLRFSRAIIDNRVLDAQQALIQLKVQNPKNRVVYMAHAAVTQLLSTSTDDLQSRLALSLARKAVVENFDQTTPLDCRVPGQIFALQNSTKDLEGIANRPFKESKQVYHALRRLRTAQVNGTSQSMEEESDPTKVPAREWLSTEVKKLKGHSGQLIETLAQTNAILSFATNATRLFHKTTTTILAGRSRNSADACFLAISSLVRLFEITESTPYLLQAAFLAEQLLKQDPHIHEARMILIYLYMRLGLGSLAMHYFDSLNIKEVQNDTVGHALFTRISCIHPHSTTLNKQDPFEPFKKTSNALSVYTRWEEKLAENQASVLEHEQTGMIFDIQELRDNLRSSLTRRIIHLENWRIGRLMHDGMPGEDMTHLGPRITANWTEITDNRDFAATFNYGYDVERVLNGREGVVPGKYWILNNLAIDAAWCLANGLESPVLDTNVLVEELTFGARGLDPINSKGDGATISGIMDAEHLAGNLACHVLRLLIHLQVDTAKLSDDIEAVSSAVEKLNVGILVSTNDILASRLADVYVMLDALRVVTRCCQFVIKEVTGCKDRLQQLNDVSKSYCKDLTAYASDQAKQNNAADVRAMLEQDSGIRETVTTVFSNESARTFSESMSIAAKNSWEGVTTMKEA